MNETVKGEVTTDSPMFAFMEMLLGLPEHEHGVPVQLVFRWDAGINAGVLSRTKTPGLYSLQSEAKSGPQSPLGAGKDLIIEQLFEAVSVARIMVVSEKKASLIEVM